MFISKYEYSRSYVTKTSKTQNNSTHKHTQPTENSLPDYINNKNKNQQNTLVEVASNVSSNVTPTQKK